MRRLPSVTHVAIQPQHPPAPALPGLLDLLLDLEGHAVVPPPPPLPLPLLLLLLLLLLLSPPPAAAAAAAAAMRARAATLGRPPARW
jgi:hypothetical protein